MLNNGIDDEMDNMEGQLVGEDREIGNLGGGMEDNQPNKIEFNRRQNAFFLLRTKESNLLTQKCVDDIVEGSTELVRNTVDTVRSALQECLDGASIQFEAVPGLEDLFSSENPIYNPFQHILTKHKQTSYFKENFGLIQPRRITLGHKSKRRRSGTTYKEVLKDDEMMYVPLIDTLQELLNQDCILSEIQAGHQRNDGTIEDICDAQLFKNHPLFANNPTALQLLLYYDEVEIANPLGSKAGKHKLGVIYFTLGNLPPKQRSQVNAIQLLAIATSPVFKEYGVDAVLEPIMKDLECLEQDGGHQFLVKGQRMMFCATIVFFSGDNLGSQLVGGFKEGAGANLKCRHCMGTANEIKTMFIEKKFTLRTRPGHNHQCEMLEQDMEFGKTYGITRRSILCNSRYFHVVDGLPGDAMHDIFEGVLQYECKEMLKVFILEQKYFTLDQLNDRIRHFDYGYCNDSNKPSPIKRQTLRNENNSLKQKAAQMWCLGKFLPLIIGGVVPVDDDNWQHFLLLLEIADIVFSSSVTIDDLGILEGLIEDYLWGFTNIYPGRSVIPKMHYLIHYPSHMNRFGPMVRTWCMRYEAKHSYFKRLAGFMGNFTNVAFTLADRHQTQMCYHMNSLTAMLARKTTVGNGKQLAAVNTNYFHLLKQKEGTMSPTDIIYESKKVSCHGTEYRIDSVVQVGWTNDLPEFALIYKIVAFQQKTYFILKTLVTIEFNKHFHAFEVRRATDHARIMIKMQNELLMYLPTHTVKACNTANSDVYVVTRYKPPMK